MLDEAKKKLENRIWTTKKARMNAEARLINTNKVLQWLILYYTLLITFLSVFSLIKTDVVWVNYSIVISSITVTVLSISINSQNYIQRASEMRINYTKLGELEFELACMDSKSLSSKDIVNVNNKYQELLRNIENHNDMDYLKSKDNHSWGYHFKFYGMQFLIFLGFALPFLGCFFIVKSYLLNN